MSKNQAPEVWMPGKYGNMMRPWRLKLKIDSDKVPQQIHYAYLKKTQGILHKESGPARYVNIAKPDEYNK